MADDYLYHKATILLNEAKAQQSIFSASQALPSGTSGAHSKQHGSQSKARYQKSPVLSCTQSGSDSEMIYNTKVDILLKDGEGGPATLKSVVRIGPEAPGSAPRDGSSETARHRRV
jgi:hypothetical protein